MKARKVLRAMVAGRRSGRSSPWSWAAATMAFDLAEEANADLEVAVEVEAGGFKDGFADEDAAENGVLGEQRVMGVGDGEHVAAEAMPGAGGGDGFGGEGVDFLVEDEEDEVAFVADVVEKGADADAGGIGDAAQGGVVVAVLGKVLAGGGEDALLPLGFGALAEAGGFGGGESQGGQGALLSLMVDAVRVSRSTITAMKPRGGWGTPNWFGLRHLG